MLFVSLSKYHFGETKGVIPRFPNIVPKDFWMVFFTVCFLKKIISFMRTETTFIMLACLLMAVPEVGIFVQC